MKPIHLAWSGLQSYREKQEIDFTLVCDAGVFGIFGATGSGKSTILDAITLALYGKVERASNGTQGILNQAENVLAVSFTFELSHAEGARKYRVERQFKRGAEVSVNNTICRLIEIKSVIESVVIADKAGEVNAQILQILGLSMQDFSRAVILPQGKFAEFLSLKGTDRRQMLQRLFHLEHYGDVLNARVSQRSKETDVSIKQIVAEQQGLGDASEATLHTTKERLEEAELLARKKKIELQNALQHWEESKRINALQSEQLELEAKRKALVADEPGIFAKEQLLKSADQAERVRHFLAEFESTTLHRQTMNTKLALITKQHNEVSARAEQVNEQYKHAKHALYIQDAPLQVRLEQLKQAALMEQEMDKGKKWAKQLEEKLKQSNLQILLIQDDHLKKQDTHARALKKQTGLQEQLKSLQVKTDYRHSLQNAAREKQSLDAMQLKIAGLRQEHITKTQQVLLENKRLEAIMLQHNESYTHLSSLLHTIKTNAFIQSKFEYRLEALKNNSIHAAEQIKKSEKSAEIARYALHLAIQLKENQSCPVCGSTEHPAPATEPTNQDSLASAISSELEQHELLINEIAKLKLNQERHTMQQLAITNKLCDALDFGDTQETVELEVAASAAMHSVSKDSHAAEALESELNYLSDQHKQFGQQLQLISEEMKLALQDKERSYQKQIEVSAQVLAMQATIDNLDLHIVSVQEEYLVHQELWHRSYPDFKLDQIQSDIIKLNEMDLASDQLTARIEQSIPFIDAINKEIQLKAQAIAEQEKVNIQLETELKGLRKANDELEEQFRMRWDQELDSGGTIAEHIQQAEQLLLQLRESEQLASKQLEITQLELTQLNEAFIASRQAADSAQTAYLKAERYWQDALEQTKFSTAEEVKAALLDKIQIEAWKQAITQHREQEMQLTVKLIDLLLKLNGQSVTEGELSSVELGLNSAKVLSEQAQKECTKLERDLEHLHSKHKQWSDLQQNLIKRNQELADLIKLQSVLRGNAFVEYIAEEQLVQVSRIASERLGHLTRQRYALEVDSSGGFIIRDDANGGVRRPVSTLSGGETFLTSLALALALSAQIQLSGQYPLEFFFLDEGFGTLDADLLETVVDALEKLHIDKLTVGIISHVPELRARLPHKIIVEAAEPGGRGSRVCIEGL